MKSLVLLLAALVPLTAHAFLSPNRPLSECAQHLPFGVPTTPKTSTTLICRPGYALQHDNRAKVPVWVAYELTREKALGCAGREEGFVADRALPVGGRATLKDYAKSGYDIGHMANSADMRWSEQASEDSNTLSNAAPQLPGLNRAAWKTLEVRTRAWALDRGRLIIYVGPIYSQKGSKTIGANQVVVPEAFYKVLVDPRTGEVVAFIYQHEASRKAPGAFRTSLAEVQRRTGLVLPVPTQPVSPRDIWPVQASVANQKAVTCRAR